MYIFTGKTSELIDLLWTWSWHIFSHAHAHPTDSSNSGILDSIFGSGVQGILDLRMVDGDVDVDVGDGD